VNPKQSTSANHPLDRDRRGTLGAHLGTSNRDCQGVARGNCAARRVGSPSLHRRNRKAHLVPVRGEQDHR